MYRVAEAMLTWYPSVAGKADSTDDEKSLSALQATSMTSSDTLQDSSLAILPVMMH